MESKKKYNKLVTVTMKKLRTNLWLPVGREEGRRQDGAGENEVQTIIYEISYTRYIVKHREYHRYFIKTINRL